MWNVESAPVLIDEQRFVLPSGALEDLPARLAGTRLPSDLGSGWERGVPIGWLRGLIDEWRAFDPDALQQRLDGLRQLRVVVGGQTLHVVHGEGRGSNPLPGLGVVAVRIVARASPASCVSRQSRSLISIAEFGASATVHSPTRASTSSLACRELLRLSRSDRVREAGGPSGQPGVRTVVSDA
jgi:hypothetical protein